MSDPNGCQGRRAPTRCDDATRGLRFEPAGAPDVAPVAARRAPGRAGFVKSQPAYDPVQQGVSLALDAHRRGFMDDRALDAILAYYDAEGAVDPFPAGEVLAKIGGLTVEQLRALHGAGPTRTPSEIQGKRFGDRLTLLEPIGEGGMGTVHRAYDRVLKRVVAVKRLRVELFEPAAKARALSRFEREAMAMARVRHPACVQIFDAGLTKEGEPYLVMEFVAGKSLRAVIEDHHGDAPRGPLDPRQVAAWGVALAEALQACHDVGLVHRDVKPANVLLDAARNPRLTDFGVALDDTARTKLTVDKAMVGTLAYMAPEQAMGEAVDARSDVYALGVTLYEVLAGQPPFDASSALLLMRQVLSVEAPALRKVAPGVPTDLETIVHKCLSKSPHDRYATAQALALDLRRFLADEPVLAKPVSAGRRLARRLWRARRAVAAAGVVSLGALVLAGLGHLRARAAERARIDAALAAAAVTSDLDAAEQEVLPLVAIAEPEQAERAREALRELRGRRRLRAAEEAFARWKAALDRRVALQAEADALRETIDARAPFAESPEKQRLLDLDQELASDEQVLARLIELEGLLAQASLDLPGPEVDALRARVLLTRGRAVEDEDPDQAERFFAAADPLDAASGGALRADLARPEVEVTSDPPAQVTLERYEFDRESGVMIAREAARGRTPCTLSVPGAAAYRVSVAAPGHFVARDLIVLTRGQRRRTSFTLVALEVAGPFAEMFVHVPGGFARVGEGLRSRTRTEDILLQVEEVSYEQWRSFHLDVSPKEVSPAHVPTDGAGRILLTQEQLSRWPAMGISWRDASAFVDWFQRELDLCGAGCTVRLPSSEEFARAVRGDLPWVYPWGDFGDTSHCTSVMDLGYDEPSDGHLAENLELPLDVSGFGVRRLAGLVSEFVGAHRGRPVAATVGGVYSAEFWAVANLLNRTSVQSPDVRLAAAGLRLVFVPRKGGAAVSRRDPSAARQALNAVFRCMREGDLLGAHRHASMAVSLDVGDPAVWIARGNVRRARGDSWGALKDYSQALRHRSGLGAALVNRGLTFLERGEVVAAMVDFDQAVEAAPQLCDAWAGRALARLRAGELAEALADVERALALDPENENALTVKRRIEGGQ